MFGGRYTAATGLVLVVILAVVAGSLGGVALAGQNPISTSSANGTGIYEQTYSCELAGGELWLNNSIPFQQYARNSTILQLPAIATWLASHNYSVSELRPYLSLYPTCGNPYDFAQGTVGFAKNGTTYLVYGYIVTNSPVGLVIGAWVAPGSMYVGSIYTYDTAGPGLVYSGGTGIAVG
jgi:hypothetical protein